jgi:alkanesulfonate monooxygenase SsuD/methylene tetrahydromethanopterin reductase-like flavin-dependent oxidoreductase (luciferase family)
MSDQPVSGPPEFHVFLPQMRLDFDELAERARAAEAAGFTGIALMDHLAPPMAEQHDMFDAMVTAAWLLARTERLTVGHLVLCDSFRHPAVLAKQAVSLDHASGGRFELGIGWGSVPEEMVRFGVGSIDAPVRVRRLAETLEVVQALWTGEVVDYAGEHHRIDGGQQRPVPLASIPIVVGGAGPKTLELVAAHASWWNCPIYALDRFDELRAGTGDSRTSIQEMVGFVADRTRREEVAGAAQRRFGYMTGLLVGDGDELVEHYRQLHARGVERFYVWFTDFAPPGTLAAFGEQVIDRS